MKVDTSKLIKNLLDLSHRFYDGESLSTKEISELYDIHIRTAQRYIKYLKDANLDIKKNKNKYFVNIPLSMENIKEIAQKLNMTIPIVNKLKSSVYYSKLDIEKIDFNKFGFLEEATKNKQKLKIIYYDFDGKKTTLTDIKPLKIANFEGYWYLIALNYKNEYRRYHIHSMEKIKVLDETFDIDDKILERLDKAINIWYDPNKKPFLVELFLDEVATRYFKRLKPFKPIFFKEEADKTSIVTLEITNENEILYFLLRWIPHIKVISPKSLKEKILKEVKKYLE